MKNYSRQREAIKKVLCSTNSHPTANWVYDEVRKIVPNISLGTVYRNLSALSDSGEILSISVGDGTEHFDGNNLPHIHLHCKECGMIKDVFFENDFLTDLAKENNFTPLTSIYVIDGICDECNSKKI